MSSAGDTIQLDYRASLTNTTETLMTAQCDTSLPFPVYWWGVACEGTDLQYIRVVIPSVMSGQSLYVAPEAVGTVCQRVTRLPAQVLIPANTPLGSTIIYGYQDSGGAQTGSAHLMLSKSQVPGIPVAKGIFSNRVVTAAGNDTYSQSAVQNVPVLPGSPKIRLVGGAAFGAGAVVNGAGLVSSRIPVHAAVAGVGGPKWSSINADVSLNGGSAWAPIPEDVIFQGGDSYYLVQKDDSAGNVANYAWFVY